MGRHNTVIESLCLECFAWVLCTNNVCKKCRSKGVTLGEIVYTYKGMKPKVVKIINTLVNIKCKCGTTFSKEISSSQIQCVQCTIKNKKPKKNNTFGRCARCPMVIEYACKTKYCKPCSLIIHKAQISLHNAKYRNPAYLNGIKCGQCLEDIINAKRNQKFCKVCADKRTKEKKRDHQRERRKNEKRKDESRD